MIVTCNNRACAITYVARMYAVAAVNSLHCYYHYYFFGKYVTKRDWPENRITDDDDNDDDDVFLFTKG